jgi:hypothetical protein
MADTTAKKTPAKRAAAKKTPVKRTPAKKSPAKKTPAAKASTDEASVQKSPAKKTAKKSSRRAAPRAEAPRSREQSSREESSSSGSGRGSRAASAARESVLDLTGKTPEAVTGLERTDEGWTVELEVLELERIPSTTDVLGTYQVTLDGDGELVGCRRVRRYLRGSPRDE